MYDLAHILGSMVSFVSNRQKAIPQAVTVQVLLLELIALRQDIFSLSASTLRSRLLCDKAQVLRTFASFRKSLVVDHRLPASKGEA